jgi:hypothetical protein
LQYSKRTAPQNFCSGVSFAIWGYKPPEHHDLSRHAAFLVDHLPGGRNSGVPFTVGAYTPSESGYGLIIDESVPSHIQLFRLDDNVLTQLGSTRALELPADGRYRFRLEIVPPQVNVFLSETCIGIHTDACYTGPFTIIDRSLVRQPDVVRMRKLRKIGDRLTKNRAPAFYSEHQYGKDDALVAAAQMNECFEIARTFFDFEEGHSTTGCSGHVLSGAKKPRRWPFPRATLRSAFGLYELWAVLGAADPEGLRQYIAVPNKLERGHWLKSAFLSRFISATFSRLQKTARCCTS